MAAINNTNVSEIRTGLHTDTSPQNQPKGSQRFALNTVNETDRGDEFLRTNEESNEACIAFPSGFIPIGKSYVGGNESIIFLVSPDNEVSEIGILKDSCKYETHVNDEDSEPEDKLGFTVEHQIQATYRLRRGCERTVYFTDDNRKPRYYNFDKPEDFKNDNGTWAGKKFNLFKEYNKIPEFNSVEVLDSGGVLEPGSINVSVQYLDEGLNPSEWIITSPTVNIYNSLSTEDFLDINGSINSDTDYINFPHTSKALKVVLSNLDENYPFYRLAFIEATAGTGNVSSVKYTELIPTSKDFFIYTGENAAMLGTQEEILFFNQVIDRAGSIEQIENRLILANTQGKQVNFCKLQKYASRVKADVVTKKVIVNQLNDPRNTKNPSVHFGDMITGGTGYMPGEMYSFGLVYVFEDGTISPVLHIPGKNPNVNPTTIFQPGPNTYPMSINNESVNNRYIDNDNCDNNEYWGLDSEGVPLQNRPVRHHRFPLRSEINLPLVKEETDLGTGEQEFDYYSLQIIGSGTITLPVICTQEQIDDEGCIPVSAPPFQVRVTFTVDGDEEEMIINVDPALVSNPINLIEFSNLYSTTDIVVTKIEESRDDGTFYEVSGESEKGVTYEASVVPSTYTTEGKIYSTEILGIKFSGVDLPPLSETNGEKIIGYYIVRNERVDNEKTILDSAVLVPTISNSKYISTGLLGPEMTDNTKISKNLFGVIHPEHKFNNKEFSSFDYIKQEGNFDIISRNYSKTSYNDVFDGTSYNRDAHKSGNDDGGTQDGFSLTLILRDNILRYRIKTLFNLLRTNIKEVFYLKALESRDINDSANTAYNIAGDNRIGMIQLDNDDTINPVSNTLPYVVIGRNILDSYSNFRTLPYYKESLNLEKFDINGVGSTSIFNGDTYVCPMRYTNTVFWDNRLAKRAGRTSVWNYIIGGILIVVGTVLAFFTAGASTIVVGAGIAIIGGGALFISSGIERDAMVKAYNEEYRKGLRETALDDWVDAFYKYRNNFYTQLFGFVGNGGSGGTGPSDDEIQWIGDTLTDLWFESTINMSLRHKMIPDNPTFLDAPGIIETGNMDLIQTWEYFGNYYTSSVSRYPVSKQDYHLNKKLLVYNSERKDSREYVGAPFGEWYEVNPDYHRRNKEKIFYHLPLEYDCCSDCQEDFPHRWHWSEQSFQEELSDNYRTFLPNNYKDLEGETGEITNIFKIGNELFMHTKEALWQIPRNYQERVTDQIVSFIGTGSYGEIPARKVIDDANGSSAGSQHKWATIKTPTGVYFPSENQRKIYEFNGQQLKPISSIGNSNWFQNNMELLMNKQYYNSTGKSFPYNNNPSNPFGTGYISTYDTKKERVIFTKKDYELNTIDNNDYEICINNGEMIYFPDFNQTIQDYAEDGWNYVGIEDCKMKFERNVIRTRTEIRNIIISLPNTAHVYVFYDTSGSFNTTGYLTSLRNAIESWYAAFRPDDIGATRLHHINNPSERWVDYARIAYQDSAHDGDILVISLVNEANSSNPATHYHTNNNIINPVTGQPTAAFTADYNTFVNTVVPQSINPGSTSTLNSFIGINYSISTVGAPYNNSKAFIQHSLLALKGVSYTNAEADDIDINPTFTLPEWDNVKATLVDVNPYSSLGPGLENYNWIGKFDRSDVDFGTTGEIISPDDFALDINNLLQNITQIEEVEVEVNYLDVESTFVEGEVFENPIKNNNSWTKSYSLKQSTWISWHSYLPNFYLNVPEKFYSWIHGNNNLWKHNRKGHYQSFYGQLHPYIIEYVSLSNPLNTRIWEYLKLIADVQVFDFDNNEFVDINDVFFDKMIAYNSRQCSGLKNIKVKDFDQDSEDYLKEQITNTDDSEIIVDRNERDWTLNNLRDIRTNYNQPIFKSDLSSLQNEYFIDKILNDSSIDYEKDWTQLESFRDKYLVIRLIFNNFAKGENIPQSSSKITMNFSGENETQSFR